MSSLPLGRTPTVRPARRWTFVATLTALAALASPLAMPSVAAGQESPPAKPAAPQRPAAPGTKPQNDSPNLSTNRRERMAPTQTRPADNAAPPATGLGATAPNVTRPVAPVGDPVIRFDPEVMDFGEMTAGVAMTKKFTIHNISNKPITVIKAVPGCGCTIPVWPKDPIPPGGSAEGELTLKPGDRQGLSLHKKVTFQLDGHPPVVYDLQGHVAEFVRVAPEMLDAPAADAAGSGTGTVTLTAVDGTPFRIVSVNPAVAKDPGTEAKTEHAVEIDWKAWADGGKSPKISFTTDHPKATTMMVLVKRPLDRNQPKPPPTSVSQAPSMTPLIQAVRSDDAAAVKMLLSSGADCNATDAVGGGRTALHWAVKEMKKGVIPLLLDAKCNIEAVDRVGKTPLAVAAEGKDLEIVKMLVEKGANVNARDQIGGSPLLWASGLGNPEVVKFLISKKAEVNVVDVNGLSPLLWAAGIGPAETVQALIEAGAKVDVADRITGDTALMRAARTGKFESLAAIVKSGAPVNARNNVGMSAFMLAAASGSVEKLASLKEAGAEVAAKDVKGWNALDYARNRIDSDRAKVVEYLAAFVPESGALPTPPAAAAAGNQAPDPKSSVDTARQQ